MKHFTFKIEKKNKITIEENSLPKLNWTLIQVTSRAPFFVKWYIKKVPQEEKIWWIKRKRNRIHKSIDNLNEDDEQKFISLITIARGTVETNTWIANRKLRNRRETYNMMFSDFLSHMGPYSFQLRVLKNKRKMVLCKFAYFLQHILMVFFIHCFWNDCIDWIQILSDQSGDFWTHYWSLCWL